MKILISGSRTYRSLFKVRNYLKTLQSNQEILVGDAKGVDDYVSIYYSLYGALELFSLRVFRADWDTHGKKAGILRNLEMLDQKPDLVVAFWNGESRGTKHVIDEALKRRLHLWVIFDEQ